MTNISLKVNGASAVASADGKITSGMVGLPVSIEYDNSWENLTKTAFFRVGGQIRKRDSIDTNTTVPWEVLRNHGKPLEIGIEGRDADGNIVVPTIWASVAMVYQGANGEIPAAPNPDSGDSPSGGGGGVEIDDNSISKTKTWSSQKISDTIAEQGGGGEDGNYMTWDDYFSTVYDDIRWAVTTPEEEGGASESVVDAVINSEGITVTIQSALDYAIHTPEEDGGMQERFAEAVLAILPIYEGEG